jgi:hypothetical protein
VGSAGALTQALALALAPIIPKHGEKHAFRKLTVPVQQLGVHKTQRIKIHRPSNGKYALHPKSHYKLRAGRLANEPLSDSVDVGKEVGRGS